jgi:hypothetical protein
MPERVRSGGWRLKASLGKKFERSQIIRAKWIEGVAQAVEHLLCKCEALIKPQFHQRKILFKGLMV